MGPDGTRPRRPLAQCMFARARRRVILALGMIGVFAWTFVGSLAMGLTTPQNSQPRMVQLWLVGLAVIVVGFGAAAWMADGPRDG